MPKNLLNGQLRPGRNRGVKVLTNNSQRRGNTWGGYKGRGFAKLGIRRLMKVDPANAQGTPDSQLLVGRSGTAGRTGASKGVAVVGHTETRQPTSNASRKKLLNRGTNRTLKKR